MGVCSWLLDKLCPRTATTAAHDLELGHVEAEVEERHSSDSGSSGPQQANSPGHNENGNLASADVNSLSLSSSNYSSSTDSAEHLRSSASVSYSEESVTRTESTYSVISDSSRSFNSHSTDSFQNFFGDF